MARSYRPAAPFNVAMILLVPTYSTEYGVAKKTFPAVADGVRINGSFRTFGGTERDVNGIYSIENTAIVETWFRPDIRGDCRIYVPQLDQTYEIFGEPENIELRNQYLQFRLRAIKGGA